jgi:hypothetical protein
MPALQESLVEAPCIHHICHIRALGGASRTIPHGRTEIQLTSSSTRPTTAAFFRFAMIRQLTISASGCLIPFDPLIHVANIQHLASAMRHGGQFANRDHVIDLALE